MLRLDPVERGIVRALCHGKDPASVGLEQDLRRDLDHDVVVRRHDVTRLPCEPLRPDAKRTAREPR